jgi:hypothetical protein
MKIGFDKAVSFDFGRVQIIWASLSTRSVLFNTKVDHKSMSPLIAQVSLNSTTLLGKLAPKLDMNLLSIYIPFGKPNPSTLQEKTEKIFKKSTRLWWIVAIFNSLVQVLAIKSTKQKESLDI